MNQQWTVRVLIALALAFTLGVTTFVITPKASAHALTCGAYTISLGKHNLVAKGVTIGYAEKLTDGCGNYELHGHLSTIPANTPDSNQSYLILASENDNYIGSPIFPTAPQDLYLGEPSNFSPNNPSEFQYGTVQSGGLYTVGF